ncbi:MAG: outer membrane protein OmpA [Flaviaesturariibacter sp.]|nr:outer membrane protein OmpA [Flaviaesturariibacter sp.]
MRFYFLLWLLLPVPAFSQNLLVNGGFEEVNICSEYKVDCAPEGWMYTVSSFNYYFKDPALAHAGQYFIGLIAGSSQKAYYRTFVRTRLLCGLRKGRSYRLQFWVKSRHSILDSVGIYFTGYDFLFEKQPYPRITPTLYLSNASYPPKKGDTSWQKVSIDYTATGEEAFMALGNFRKTDLRSSTGIRLENKFFVLFDDISLVPLDPMEALCKDWKERKEEIYAQDERHEYQERQTRLYKKMPATVVKNTITKQLKVDTLVMPDILFATNSFSLDKKALLLLDSFLRHHNGYALDSIVVEGHTDNLGKAETNNKLSQSRAESVAAYLQYSLSEPVFSRGWGSSKPVADNRQPSGRRKNRRVEVYLYLKE